MRSLSSRLSTFVFFGVLIVLFTFGIIIFSYILLAGLLVGALLYLIAWIKETFFHSQSMTPYKKTPKRPPQTIDHDSIP